MKSFKIGNSVVNVTQRISQEAYEKRLIKWNVFF